MIDLTDLQFRLCMEIYFIYDNGSGNRSFQSATDLGKRVEKSVSASTTIKSLIKELLLENVLFWDRGLCLNTDVFDDFMSRQRNYVLMKSYLAITKPILFRSEV